MNKKVWYEVFISNEQGTRTLETFDTIPEARDFKKNFEENELGLTNWEGKLYIDMWENTDNPKKIKDIK